MPCRSLVWRMVTVFPPSSAARAGTDYIQAFLDEEPHPMIAAMNYLKYDAWTLGNHEFNFDFKYTTRQRQELLARGVSHKNDLPFFLFLFVETMCFYYTTPSSKKQSFL